MGFHRRNIVNALLLSSALVCPQLVHAQDSAPPAPADADAAAGAQAPGGLQDIVVTARKTAENLQRVPVAITAFSGAALKEQSLVQVADVAKMTPSLVIRESTNGPTSVVFQLRGQFQNDTLATLDPSVGVYVDGYYWARAQGVNADFLDVKDVQVLKGPQGTLFGRNTTGGAILIDTNDPVMNRFGGSVSAQYGRFDERGGTAVVNVPLVNDLLAVRGAFTILKRDGFVKNLESGPDLGNRNSWTGRGKALFTPASNVRLEMSAEVYHANVLVNPYQLAYVAPGSIAPLEVGFEAYGAGDAATRASQGAALLDRYIDETQGKDKVGALSPSRNFAHTATFASTLTVGTAIGDLKVIGGYRRVRDGTDNELTGAPYKVLDYVNRSHTHQYSIEAQLTGKLLENRLSYAAGALYFREAGSQSLDGYPLAALNPDSPAISDGDISNRSRGIYGQGTYHITDKLSFTGGLRYSWDTKGLTLHNRTYDAATGVFDCTLPLTAQGCSNERSDLFKGLSYTAGFDYQFTSKVLAYAKVSKGFRSGGQNLYASGSLDAFLPFKPEKVLAWETGLKSQFLDNRIRLNLAAYYSTVDDIQRSTVVSLPSGQAITLIGNAGRARIWGIEADAVAKVAPAVELAATGAYTDPKYLKYFDGVTDRRAERFDNVPKYTFTMSAAYSPKIALGDLNLRLDYSFQGKTPQQPYTPVLDTVNPPDVQQQILKYTTSKAYGTLNARAAIAMLNERLELAIYGKNLTNVREKVVALYLPAPLNYVLTERHEPVTFGVSATYKFGD